MFKAPLYMKDNIYMNLMCLVSVPEEVGYTEIHLHMLKYIGNIFGYSVPCQPLCIACHFVQAKLLIVSSMQNEGRNHFILFLAKLTSSAIPSGCTFNGSNGLHAIYSNCCCCCCSQVKTAYFKPLSTLKLDISLQLCRLIFFFLG